MEQMINSFNIEIGVFLRNLRAYSNHKDVYIGDKTIGLLSNTITCIDKLINTSKMVDIQNELSVDFLNDLDEQCFELRRNIMCRCCIEQIALSKGDFDTHVQKVSHVIQARTKPMLPIQNLSDSRSAKSVHDAWKLERSQSVKQEETSVNQYTVNQSINLVMDATTDENANGIKRRYESVFEKIDCARREQVDDEKMQRQEKREEHRIKKQPLENVVDEAWKGVRILESSDTESNDSSSSFGFNYDSLYLMEVRNLPPTATRQEIMDFFKGITILNGKNGIHFMLDEKNRKLGRAFIQLENMDDYKSAHKYHLNCLDNQFIQVTPGNIKKFKEMVAERKIPSKDRVVFVEGLPRKYNEQKIRILFQGLKINRVHLVQSGTDSLSSCAYVKLSNMKDVEVAIKIIDQKSGMRIYRSTDQQMRYCYQSGLKHALGESTFEHDIQPQSNNDHSKSDSKSHSNDGCKYVKVRGIPLVENEQYVYDLFPGLEIDPHNGVQMERDKKNSNTGAAFVEIKSAADYDIALKANLKDTSRYLKVTKATRAEFFINKEANELLNN